MTDDGKLRAEQEMAYCEAILAKSNLSILLKVLPSTGLATWKHYPELDVFDPVSGAQWYYHCHEDSDEKGEHGHFHCFIRPEGPCGPACHLIAIGVNGHGKLTRIFTVNQWVVGGEWFDAEKTNALLDDFNVELAHPDYLVNRWLTAVITLYDVDIRRLNEARDAALANIAGSGEEARQNRAYEVLSELRISS